MDARHDRSHTSGALGCALVTAATLLLTAFLLVAIAIPTGIGGRARPSVRQKKRGAIVEGCELGKERLQVVAGHGQPLVGTTTVEA